MDLPTRNVRWLMQDLRAQIASLKEELDSLRARYDTLLEAKNRAAERYKADYKKWRDFRDWLFPDAKTDDDIKSILKDEERIAHIRESALGKRKLLEDLVPNLDEVEDVKQESCKPDISGSPPLAKRQRRKSYHGDVLSSSPSSNKDPFLVPLDLDCNNNKSEIPCKAEPSQPIPRTEPRKGRGRYAQASSGMDTINSRFSIRKDRNNGVDFQYDAVVRNRQERKHMLGGDCECCHEYYEAIGPLPASRQPLWRTPTKSKASHNYPASKDKENDDEVDEHKQRISRHRHHWHRPKTPPGYWDIGFPDTQEVLDINRRAAEMHKRKLVEVESEARNNNGRYVKRAPRTP